MPAIHPGSIDHLVYRIANVEQTELFYRSFFGAPSYRDERVMMYMVGETRLFFTAVSPDKAAPHDKEKIGLNHLAFGIRTLADLQAMQAQLDDAGIANSGVKLDPHGEKDYIWLDDPDGMRIEFYLREQ